MKTGNNQSKIAVVVPCYKCARGLNELHSRLVKTLKRISSLYEIILINDRSPENDWEIIKSICRNDKRVVGICLSRNFGQHNAITAGLDFCNADWVVVMDGDLQDQPEEIEKLYNKALEGYDQVIGRRKDRKDKFLKILSSRLFFMVYNYLSDTKIDSSIGNFGIYSRDVIENIKRVREQNRSFGLFAIWVGFNRIEIDIEHSSRPIGKSSYSLRKSLSLAFDSIVAHSNKLLKITVKSGFILSLFSFVYSLWLVLRYILWKIPVEGWTSLMVSLYFLSGLILVSIGVVGIYIGKIFDEGKHRPLYIVDKVINNNMKRK